MSESVGQIQLDLLLNSQQFKTQLNDAVKQNTSGFQKLATTGEKTTSSLCSGFTKLGGVLAGAFAVTKLVAFTKECINLGSALSEVQNVVDTVFTSMNNDVNQFAKSASNAYGLSENTAKKYTSTFGAMAESFGFTEKQAYDMSTTLTALSGDVASFYNISSDQAYTKLKSVFTGETESLKELGIVMTQSALDAYAMANGFGKTTSEMSEAEKVALRYSFVQSKLTKASGDFTKTQDSWANQTRILSLRWESFMASMGNGFINILRPGLILLNKFLEKLMILGEAFSDITSKLFGTADATKAITATTDDIGDSLGTIGDVADDNTDSVNGTTKAVQKLQRYLMGFDQINKLGDNSSNNDTPGSDIDIPSGGAGSTVTVDTTEATKNTNGLTSALSGFIDKLKEIKDIFKEGFFEGLKGANFDIIIENLKAIGESLKDIFTDPAVTKAMSDYYKSWVSMLGALVGTCARIGISIGNALTGGIRKYLEKYAPHIKKSLVNIFNVKTQIVDQAKEFILAMGDIICDTLNSDVASEIVSNLVGIFVNGYLGVVELMTRLGRDIITAITQPIIDNKDKITEALLNTLEVFQPILEGIENLVTNTFNTIIQVYDSTIKPALDEIISGISWLLGKVLDGYNTYIAPVMQNIGNDIKDLMDNYVQPVIDKVVILVGKVVECVSAFFNNVLRPALGWIIDTLGPILGPVLQAIWDSIRTGLQTSLSIIGDLLDFLGGFIDFLTGVFSGDWDRVWLGCQEMLDGVLNAICHMFGTTWDDVQRTLSNVGEWFGNVFINAYNAVTGAWGSLTTWFSNLWDKVAQGARSAGSWMWDGLTSGFNTVIDGIKSALNWVISGLNKIAIDVPNWVPGVGGNHFGVNIPMLAQGGYVKANQPQLAVIGDNKTQGEIVAPEDKIKQCMAEVLGTYMSMLTPQQGQEMLIDLTVNLGDETLAKKIVRVINDLNRQHGVVQVQV